MDLVAEVVARGGYLPELGDTKKPFFSKKNGVVFGVFWFAFFSMFCTSFFGILGAPDELVGILAVTGFFIGLMITVASLIFLPSSKVSANRTKFAPPPPSPADFGLNAGASRSSLPPAQHVPAVEFPIGNEPVAVPRTGRWKDTNDFEPGSVTDSTTRLLDRDDQ